jgi:altronate dehydratase
MSQLTATDSAAQPVAQHTSSAVQRTSAGVKIDKDRIEANGVKERSRGGLCRLVWDALDEMREADQTTIPTVADIKKRATEKGWNINNASIEYYQWRKFNGIKGRTKKA